MIDTSKMKTIGPFKVHYNKDGSAYIDIPIDDIGEDQTETNKTEEEQNN